MKQIWKQCLAASIAFAIGAAGAAEASRPGDKPLVVNGELSLTTLDFDAFMERIPADRRDEFRAEYEKINPTVDQLWMRRVLAQRAREAGLDKDPIVAARIRLAVEDVLTEVYLSDYGKKVKVPDLEGRARELYKAHAKEFVTPEVITAEHILVSTKTYSHEAARARAQEVYKRAMAGENFRKLAEEYTDNKSSIEMKSMAVTPTSFVRPLPEAIAKLNTPGQIMAPVESQYGFHIIKLEEKVPSRTKKFEEVKGDLIAMEKQKIIDEDRTQMVEAIRGDPKNYLYVENVRDLKSSFRMPTAEEIKKSKPDVRY